MLMLSSQDGRNGLGVRQPSYSNNKIYSQSTIDNAQIQRTMEQKPENLRSRQGGANKYEDIKKQLEKYISQPEQDQKRGHPQNYATFQRDQTFSAERA